MREYIRHPLAAEAAAVVEFRFMPRKIIPSPVLWKPREGLTRLTDKLADPEQVR